MKNKNSVVLGILTLALAATMFVSTHASGLIVYAQSVPDSIDPQSIVSDVQNNVGQAANLDALKSLISSIQDQLSQGSIDPTTIKSELSALQKQLSQSSINTDDIQSLVSQLKQQVSEKSPNLDEIKSLITELQSALSQLLQQQSSG